MRRMSFGLIPIAAFMVLAPASASETVTYQYDAQGRLVKVVKSGNVNNGRVDSFCHDDADNRTKWRTNGSGTQPGCVSTSANTASAPAPTQ